MTLTFRSLGKKFNQSIWCFLTNPLCLGPFFPWLSLNRWLGIGIQPIFLSMVLPPRILPPYHARHKVRRFQPWTDGPDDRWIWLRAKTGWAQHGLTVRKMNIHLLYHHSQLQYLSTWIIYHQLSQIFWCEEKGTIGDSSSVALIARDQVGTRKKSSQRPPFQIGIGLTSIITKILV